MAKVLILSCRTMNIFIGCLESWWNSLFPRLQVFRLSGTHPTIKLSMHRELNCTSDQTHQHTYVCVHKTYSDTHKNIHMNKCADTCILTHFTKRKTCTRIHVYTLIGTHNKLIYIYKHTSTDTRVHTLHNTHILVHSPLWLAKQKQSVVSYCRWVH